MRKLTEVYESKKMSYKDILSIIKSGKIFTPKDNNELLISIQANINEFGNECNLNNIDISNITDLSNVFKNNPDFNGDVSKWNTSNVIHMRNTFSNSDFNGDISKWNTLKVTDMSGMFENSKFNKDISKWNVEKVLDMAGMFRYSKFNKDISKWNVSTILNQYNMFKNSPLDGKEPSWYKK